MRRFVLALAAACALALVGLACASEPPAPASPLRQSAAAAAEAGSTRFEARHYAAAARSFGRAAEVYGALDDRAAEATALRNQAEALRRTGKLEDAVGALERALALDTEGAWPAGQARDLAGMARCHAERGDEDGAIERAEAALAIVPDTDPVAASLEIDLAVYLIARGRPADQPRVVALLDAVARRADAAAEPRTRAAAHLHLGRAHRLLGSPGSADVPLRQALDEFRTLDDPAGLARTHEELGLLQGARADTANARRHLEQARRGYAFLGDEAALARIDDLLGEGRD
jgi:tetratricopeptide (TPR) repeat protein